MPNIKYNRHTFNLNISSNIIFGTILYYIVTKYFLHKNFCKNLQKNDPEWIFIVSMTITASYIFKNLIFHCKISLVKNVIECNILPVLII